MQEDQAFTTIIESLVIKHHGLGHFHFIHASGLNFNQVAYPAEKSQQSEDSMQRTHGGRYRRGTGGLSIATRSWSESAWSLRKRVPASQPVANDSPNGHRVTAFHSIKRRPI